MAVQAQAAQAGANAAAAAYLADALAQGATPALPRHVFFSPGSRSTPLLLALRAHPAVVLHAVLDERAAAFAALGLSRASGALVAVLYTSGSAGAHALPAVLEAAHMATPLLLLTADRPQEAHNIGAAQTCEQRYFFAPHTRGAWSLPEPIAATDGAALAAPIFASWRTIVGQAIACATAKPPGPVHLNVPFREPLGTHAQAYAPQRLVQVRHATPTLCPAIAQKCAAALAAVPRGIVICGPQAPTDAPVALVVQLAQRLGWPLLLDPASQGRSVGNNAAQGIEHYDVILRSPAARAALQADAILCLGMPPTSKALQQFIAAPRARHVCIAPETRYLDPSGRADEVLVGPVEQACAALVAALPEAAKATPAYKAQWQAAQTAAAQLLQQPLAGTPEWEGAAMAQLCAALPASTDLFVGNSLAVRDLDSFVPRLPQQVRVFVSRGVNGIDGNLATALGMALSPSVGPVVAAMGDLTFLHDLGSLRLLAQANRPVTVVVFDNSGGEIFAQLPIAKHTEVFEDYFRTPQDADIEALCNGAGIAYVGVDAGDGLQQALQARFAEQAGTQALVLHVRMQTQAARTARKKLLAAVADGMDAAAPRFAAPAKL